MKDQSTNDDTMDLQEGARFLHLGLEAMKELVAAGEVPALVLNQKHTVMLREDLIGYIREKGRKQAEERRTKQILRPVNAAGVALRPRKALPDLSLYEIDSPKVLGKVRPS